MQASGTHGLELLDRFSVDVLTSRLIEGAINEVYVTKRVSGFGPGLGLSLRRHEVEGSRRFETELISSFARPPIALNPI